MTTIIALDLATNAGFCALTDGQVVEVGSWDLSDGIPGPVASQPAGHALKLQRLHRELLALACRHSPVALVAVEADFGRGSGSVLLSRLQGVAHVVAMEIGAIPFEVNLGDWREDVHGVTGEDTDTYKALALERCREDGVEVSDADAAEAYCIGRFMSDRAVFYHREPGRRRRAA